MHVIITFLLLLYDSTYYIVLCMDACLPPQTELLKDKDGFIHFCTVRAGHNINCLTKPQNTLGELI